MSKKSLSLYKFYSFNWFYDKGSEVPKSFFIDGLKGKYIFCQDIDKLNDPFENKSILILEKAKSNSDLNDKKKILIAFTKKIKRENRGKNPIISISSIKRFSLHEFNENLSFYGNSYLRVVNSNNSAMPTVSCFSKRNNHELMWGHYADGMKGVCIEYEVNSNAYKNAFSNVTYSNLVGESNIWDFMSNNHDYLKSWHANKSKVWEYEEEVRIIRYSGVKFLRLEEDNYLNICFGCKAKVEDVKAVLDILDSWSIKPSLSVAYPKDDGYEVIIKNYEERSKLVDAIIKYSESRQVVDKVIYR